MEDAPYRNTPPQDHATHLITKERKDHTPLQLHDSLQRPTVGPATGQGLHGLGREARTAGTEASCACLRPGPFFLFVLLKGNWTLKHKG